jgi:peroxiredoxin Q/BCP
MKFIFRLSVGICASLVAGQIGVAQSRTSLEAFDDGIVSVSAPQGIRNILIGQIAPVIALRSANGQKLEFQEHLGQESLMFLLVGRTTSSPSLFLPPKENLGSQMKMQNVKFTVVLPSTVPVESLSSPTVMWDRSDALPALFNIEPTDSSLIVIDRAGFVRHVESFSQNQQSSASAIIERGLASLASIPSAQSPTSELRVGQTAPDFAMPDMNGRMLRLSDLRGKVNLLLTFFPKCFTGRCTTHLSSLRDVHDSLQKEKTTVWAVSVDPADGEKGQRAYARDLALPFPLVPDSGRNLSILYGAARNSYQLASRMSVLIDKNGTIRWIDKQINPHTHGSDVLARVQSENKATPPLAP